MRLVIGGPTHDLVPASFLRDVVDLHAMTRALSPLSTVVVGFVNATYVHVGRETFLEQALRLMATHVLWLDIDMTFPADTVLRLARHQRPIVACNYVMRDDRQLFTAQRNGQRIATTPESTSLELVDSVGMGVMLMQTDIVDALLRPWFQHGRNPETGADVGEDVGFCRALRAAGHQIYIDHDLSKEIGHIGQHIYRPASQTALAV